MKNIPALKKSICVGVCAVICLFSNKLMASCDPSVAKNPPGVTPPNYYGNSQTDKFRCAINGGTDLSLEELNERAALTPQKVTDRFYIRLGMNASSEGVLSIKNTGISPSTQSGSVAVKQLNVSSNNVELAVGYTWTDFAIDIEWLALKSITYNSFLGGISPNVYYNTTTKGDAVLANFYWIFQNLYNFNFYGVGVIGSTNNKCSTFLSAGGPVNVINKKYSVSYGAGLGVRFNIISSVFADMSARYLRLGETKYEAANSTNTTSITLKGARRWIGMSVRLLWLF